MKKLSYLTFFIAIFIASTFTSCENEPLEGEFFTTPDGTDGTDDGEEEQSEECAMNFDLLASTQAAFASADAETYTAACTAYATLLDFLILECGDTDGSLQNTLNSLGDCSAPNLCTQARARTAAAKIAFENADEDTQRAACFAYLVALEAQIEVCGDAGGVSQAIIDSLPCDNDCENATAAAAQAQEAFAAVDPLNENAYVQACNLYKEALQAQINACDDPAGTLLETIQSLGECTPPEPLGPLQMTIDGAFKNFNTVDVSISGSTLSILATDEDVNDTFFFRVVLNQVGVNVLQEETLFLDTVEFVETTDGDNEFQDEATVNMSGVLQGTFSGNMTNADGDIVVITDGVFDITY